MRAVVRGSGRIAEISRATEEMNLDERLQWAWRREDLGHLEMMVQYIVYGFLIILR